MGTVHSFLPRVTINYKARSQFIPFHKRTQRYACLVCHRRAGKTVACVHDLVDAALRSDRDRPRFGYVAPFRSQAKSIVWDYLRAATAPLRAMGATLNEAELRADYPSNSSQVRLYGSDNVDALRGIYLDGVVLDEFADMDPRVWSQVLSPALSDRRGWAVFIGTPKGHGPFYKIWTDAQNNPDWFSMMLKASESGLLPADELEAQRKTKSEEEYAQEYECSFEAAILGAYYGKLMARAEEEKRITGVAYEPTNRVWTSWDLGIRDATSIWFAQTVGREVHIIDHYEASGHDLGHYVRELTNRPYVYAGHIVPHDAQARELGTGKSRIEVLSSLGLKNIQVAPDHRVEDGINAVRTFLPKCWFDKVKCAHGIEALKLYRSDFSDKLRTFRPGPVHDWASHAADSFRYLAMAFDSVSSDAAGFGRKMVYPKTGWQ